MNEASGVYKFVGVGELAETVTQLLALGLNYETELGRTPGRRSKSGLEQIEQLILQQARDYLAEVREGFVLTVRTAQVSQRSELQFLLDRVLVDWNALSAELGLTTDDKVDENATTASDTQSANATDTQGRVEQVRQQVLAFGMAAIALGHLPKLDAKQVTFPYGYSDPPTYADIPTPTTPGAMLSRIEELEQMTWQLMCGDLQSLLNRRYGALRRTYGFFEVSAYLARREAERFGIKQRPPQIALL